MVKTKDLHELIKHLSKPEKRYFKAKTLKLNPDGTKYLKLFDLLDRMPNFSAKKFGHLITKENIAGNVSFTQNYLFNILLDEIQNFRKQNNQENRLRDLLVQADFLYERNLLSLCKNVLKSASKLSLKYEFYDIQINVKESEKNLMKLLINKKGISKPIIKLNQEIQSIESRRKNHRELKNFLVLIYNFKSNGFDLRDEKKLEEFEILVKKLDEIQVDKDSGFRILFYYYVIQETIANVYELNSVEFGRKILNLYELYPHFRDIDLVGYIKSLLNYLQGLIETEEFDEFSIRFEELRKIKAHCHTKGLLFLESLIEEGELVSNYYYTSKKKQFDLAERHLELLNNYLNEKEVSLHKKMWYLHGVPAFYFEQRRFEKALDWNIKLLNIPSSQGINIDYYSGMKILEIILHFELGNFLLLDNLISTNRKYLIKHNRFFKLETILFKLFRNKHFISGNRQGLKMIIAETINELVVLKENKEKYEVHIDQADYLKWLKYYQEIDHN